MTFIGWSHGENWASYSHKQLYGMVRTDADVTAAAATEAEMAAFRAMMEESVDDVEQALTEAGVSWEGLAAESMNAGVSPLAQWARDAAVAADSSGTSARDVGEAFSRTSNGMPEPVVTPSKTVTFPPTVEDLIAAQQDQDAAERKAQNAKLHAVELMETYSTNSAAAQTSVGTFVPPQGVTVGSPEPKPGVIEVDDAVDGPVDGGDPRQPGDTSDSGYRGGPVSGDGEPVGGGPAGRETTPGAAPAGTDPARVTSPPNRFPPAAGPVTAPVTGGSPVAAFGPVPVGGDVGGRGADRVAGRGPGGAPGSGGGGTGRGPAGGGTPGRGGAVGTGPLAGEPVAARGGAGAAARPGSGMGGGFGPMGAGRRDDEDKERTSPEYLRDFRDDFWDTTPPVAPPVIGDEEDD